MGIKERIAEIREQERSAREAEEAREKELEREQEDRYRRELDPMILQQRELFRELQDIGLVSMIEEMTYPGKLEPPLTEEEQEASGIDLALGEPGQIPFHLTGELIRKRWDEASKQKWVGEVLYPRQNEDGSLDSTLRIEINNDTGQRRGFRNWFGTPLLQRVWISYTTDKALEIRGAETFFSGTVTRNSKDLDVLEEALAKAFHKPETKVPHAHLTHHHLGDIPIRAS